MLINLPVVINELGNLQEQFQYCFPCPCEIPPGGMQIYEVGASNLGHIVLYTVLNEVKCPHNLFPSSSNSCQPTLNMLVGTYRASLGVSSVTDPFKSASVTSTIPHPAPRLCPLTTSVSCQFASHVSSGEPSRGEVVSL